MRARYRSVFISDVHLGSGGSRAAELAALLKRVECEHLYLVGDIIDMWRLRQRWYWPRKHNLVITRIMKAARKGAKVTFIPGNHDEHARQFIGLDFGGVRIEEKCVHTTADGHKLLVTHGDQFDMVVLHYRLLSILGGWAYDNLVRLNRTINAVRRLLGRREWSLSKSVKDRVKTATQFIARFEQSIVSEAKRGGFTGVVCGHIHKPQDREIDGVRYLNCGDWIEGGTMIVEHASGELELVDGLALLQRMREASEHKRRSRHGAPSPSQPAADPATRRVLDGGLM